MPRSNRITELWRGYSPEPHVSGRPGNTGVSQQHAHEAAAQVGSILLRDATIRAIMAHADRIGTDVDTAAAFLLSWRRA